jgi:hypothetical protein
MKLCLNAAESGHLVITTLHATNAEEAVYRLCYAFPPESQSEVRYQFASTLSRLIVQHLLYYDRAKIRIPVLSIVRGTTSVKSLIRDNKLNQLEGTVQFSRGEGMFTEERYMAEYINERKSFFRPNQIFQVGSDAAMNSAYKSPVVDAQRAARPSKTVPRSFETFENQIAVNHYGNGESGDGYVAIDEKASIEELMSELDLSKYKSDRDR